MQRLSVGSHRGFTIAELLIGMAVGLLVLLAVTSVYITTLKTSALTLASSRLNQEMSAIINIMANDIRRAGYWSGGAANFMIAHENPFGAVERAATTADISAPRVHDNGGSGDPADYVDVTYGDPGGGSNNFAITGSSVGSCITYSYDAVAGKTYDVDGVTEIPADDEEFGFRWDGWPADRADYDSTSKEGLLLMRTSNNTSGPNSCADGNWLAVNEFSDDFSDGVIITNLQFDMSASTCYNASEPDGDPVGGASATIDADQLLEPTEFNCYAVAPKVTVAGPPLVEGHSTVESLQVVITLTAELANNPDSSATLRQTVQLRNNLIRVR
jgi:prepilin peptidase dependent protein B